MQSELQPSGISVAQAKQVNGWLYVQVEGEPYERGYSYGQQMANEMKNVQRIIPYFVMQSMGVEWSFFVRAAGKHFTPNISRDFNEFYEEMRGFSEGVTAAGTPMSLDEVVAWNCYFTLTENWFNHMPEEEQMEIHGVATAPGSAKPTTREGCSAFIAVGSEWTQDGGVVIGHNNFANFADGQFARVVLDMRPAKGNRILMMGFPGWIWSGTDFFVTSAGFIGSETTIGGFVPYAHNTPICCRIRQAMQYGMTLDDYTSILLDGNSGDYANSWLIADVTNNEIMRIELGLRFHNIEKTKNGYFVGFNAAYDPRIRNLECVNSGFDDTRRHQGARRVRLEQLMQKHKGHITADIGKEILADHYDVYLNREENPSSRTCCAHYNLDDRASMSTAGRPLPFQGRGAIDGNVCDSTMAKAMSFELRYGNSCGMAFSAEEWLTRHPQWAWLRGYVWDRPSQPWTVFTSAYDTDYAPNNEVQQPESANDDGDSDAPDDANDDANESVDEQEQNNAGASDIVQHPLPNNSAPAEKAQSNMFTSALKSVFSATPTMPPQTEQVPAAEPAPPTITGGRGRTSRRRYNKRKSRRKARVVPSAQTWVEDDVDMNYDNGPTTAELNELALVV